MGNINGVRTEFLPEDGKFVVSFGKSVDIPVNSGDDISLRAYLIDNARETIISKPIEATCRMDSNNSVIWNTYRDFKVTTPLGSFLRVELLDSRNNEDIIGYTDIPINEYWDEDEHTFSMEIMKEIVQKSSQKSSSQKVATKVSNPNFSISLRRCFLIDPVPQRQVFFLVRHGESVWNRAQETGNMANLLKFDHSLTCRGVEQQCDLNKRWKSALSKGGPNGTTQPKVHPLESGFSAVELEQYYTSRFLHATHIYCSPLTRAIQSTLVGLRDHPTMVNRGITLYSVIREIKSAGGFDTVGSKFGEAILERVREELAELVGQTEADILTSPRINFNDASGPWWTSQLSYDSEKEVSARVDEFLQFVRFSSRPEIEASIFVGHSLFFKTVCKRTATALALNRPELAGKLRRYKLGHAAVLAVTVNYTDDSPIIEDAALLFGSNFHEH